MFRSNALGVASPQGSLSTIYVCTTLISDSVSLSTSEEVSASDSVCTPLRVPWHNDGLAPCLADQTQPLLSLQVSMVMKKDAKMSNLVTETEQSNLLTETEKSDFMIKKKQSYMGRNSE